MKTLIKNYSFNKTNKTITFNDYISINLENILLITNVTKNIIIYNFADSLVGGTVNNNILTLNYDTSTMDDTDKLQIFYDEENTNFNNLVDLLIQNQNEIMHTLQSMKTAQGVPDSAGRVRINMETGTTLATVTSVGDLTSLNGILAKPLAIAGSNLSADNLRNRIEVS